MNCFVISVLVQIIGFHCERFQVKVCVDVERVEQCDASGGQMAFPNAPSFGVEGLQLTGDGHGGLIFLLLDQ